LGIDCDLAFWIASRKRGFIAGSGAPILAATVISRASLENIFERTASCRPLRCMMFLNCEWPAMKHLIFALVLDWPPYKTLPPFRPEAQSGRIPSRSKTKIPIPALPLTGGCQCGKIRYRLHARPLVFYLCHCKECQRHTSSAFGESLRFEARRHWMSTRAWPCSAAQAMPAQMREGWFCPDCGVRIWHGTKGRRKSTSRPAPSMTHHGWHRPGTSGPARCSPSSDPAEEDLSTRPSPTTITARSGNVGRRCSKALEPATVPPNGRFRRSMDSKRRDCTHQAKPRFEGNREQIHL
jgi:hypothetical protein